MGLGFYSIQLLLAPPRPFCFRIMADLAAGDEVAYEFRFFRVNKDGRIHFFKPPVALIPPSIEPDTGVRSKDVVISSNPLVSARIFLPPNPNRNKLPLLFYIHGGGFCMQSAFSQSHHSFASTVAAESNSLVVSIEYGLFPERPIPGCYDDCWAALLWVASHSSGNGPDSWINDHADLTRIFMAGNSAGGNITHYLAAQVGGVGLPGQTRVEGAILVHPYFGGTEDDAMWMYMCPMNEGLDDPRLRERKEDLERLGCKRVLVFVAEKDHLMAVGVRYYEALRMSTWQGTAELVVNNGEGHCFYLSDSACQNAIELKEKFVWFIKGSK